MGIAISSINRISISANIRKGLPIALKNKFLFLWTGSYSSGNLKNSLGSDVITITDKDFTTNIIPSTSIATFAVPNNATYLGADGTDDFWYNSSNVLQQKTFADLIASTTLRTFIKYTDFEPYEVSAIGILKEGEVLTEADKIDLNKYFKLWTLYWSNTFMFSGYIKDNRIFPENIIAISGDSATGVHLALSAVATLMDADTYSIHNLATSGDTIANQVTRWNALVADKSRISCVFVCIGHNDLSMTTPDIIAAYQGLINTIRADIGSLNKVVGVTMIPCSLATDQQWADLNEAIRGNGATPITGLDAVIDLVATDLNNGSNGLAAEYDSGDATHENDLGRQLIADLYDAQLDVFLI